MKGLVKLVATCDCACYLDSIGSLLSCSRSSARHDGMGTAVNMHIVRVRGGERERWASMSMLEESRLGKRMHASVFVPEN
jgi:hypothetical protein